MRRGQSVRAIRIRLGRRPAPQRRGATRPLDPQRDPKAVWAERPDLRVASQKKKNGKAQKKQRPVAHPGDSPGLRDRKSTRLNSSHANISYAVFCLKKKKTYSTVTSPS